MDILDAILDNNLERVRELISENPEILNQLPNNPLILSIVSYDNENEVRLQIIKLILDHYNKPDSDLNNHVLVTIPKIGLVNKFQF